MARIYGMSRSTSYNKKKTVQGSGTYTKKSHSGGETHYENKRAGSTPSARHRRKKPYRGQGR